MKIAVGQIKQAVLKCRAQDKLTYVFAQGSVEVPLSKGRQLPQSRFFYSGADEGVQLSYEIISGVDFSNLIAIDILKGSTFAENCCCLENTDKVVADYIHSSSCSLRENQ